MLACQAFADDGDEQSENNCESTGEHICLAPDEITGRFCRATRGQDLAAINAVLNELFSEATRYVKPLFKKWQLSQALGEIAASEAVLKLVEMATLFDCNCSVRPLLRVISRNQAMNMHRAQRALRHVSLFTKDGRAGDADNLIYDFADRPPTETILDEFVRREDHARRDRDIEELRSAIAQLPPIECEVVEGRLAGQSNRVIAKKLRMDNQEVAVLFFRAKGRLRRALSDCIDVNPLAGKRRQTGPKPKKSSQRA